MKKETNKVNNSTKVLILIIIIGVTSIIAIHNITNKTWLIAGCIGLTLIVILGFLMIEFGCNEIVDQVSKTINETFEEVLSEANLSEVDLSGTYLCEDEKLESL